MNSLSWMIYLADALDSVGTLCDVLAVGLAIAAAGGVLIMAHLSDEGKFREEGSADKYLKGVVKFTVVPFVICSLTACLIPSKDTMYLIAASELGEYLSNTDVAQAGADMVKDLFGSISAHLKANLPDTIEAAKEVAKQ